ncbi:MAG: hypothetical protein ACLUHE_14580 [Christensenellales bacterium]
MRFAALVEKGLLRQTRQFEDARLEPFRRKHVDQKRTADVQPLMISSSAGKV